MPRCQAPSVRRKFPPGSYPGTCAGASASGTVVSIISQVIQFLLLFFSTVLLARILSPEDFGLVAMVTAMLGYFRILKDAGLSVATIQREDITHAQVSNLFWLNVAVSAVAGVLFAACAPAIAWFYREPALVPIAVALGTTFLLSGLAIQHMALLSREMRFKSIAMVQIVSTSTGVGTGIGMALAGFGYWSLVAMQIATPLVALAMTWWASRWRPRSPSRNVGTWPLIKFGANLTATNLVYSIARGLDAVLIGRIYGAGAMGLYSRAAALLVRPLEQFMSPINAVSVPILSRLQGDTERYRRAFLQVFEAIALFGFVLSGLLLPLAHPLTLVLLGPNWEGAAPILAGFVMLGLAHPLADACTWLFTSQGRGGDFFVATNCASTLTVVAFTAGLPFGAQGVAIAFSGTSVLVILPTLFYLAGRTGPVGRGDLFSSFVRHLPVWAVVSCTTFLVRHVIGDAAPWVQLELPVDGTCGRRALHSGISACATNRA